MEKYQEEHYLFENIKDSVYPWLKEDYYDKHALNGKHIDAKTTFAISFLGDLKIVFVIKRENEQYEIIEDAMLPPDMDAMELFSIACENMARDIEFVIGSTFYGAFSVIADGIHEASSLLLKHIWNVCADKLESDLVIALPTKDTVLFAKKEDEKALEKIRLHCESAKAQENVDLVTDQWFLFEYESKELKEYQ